MEDYFNYTKNLFDPTKVQEKPEVFKGLRVLDFTHVVYGPTTAKILGQYGAEVIKFELPWVGDLWRFGVLWGSFWRHSSVCFHFVQYGKYFFSLNLKLPKAKEIILKMAEQADVVVENFAAGTTDAWGIGYSQLSKANPGIIYISCATYGQYGPMRFFPGWDLLAQAASGVISLTGYPDTDKYYKLPDYVGDFLPGNVGALAVIMALNQRKKTGKGQYIDLAQTEALMRIIPNFTYHSITGEDLGRSGNTDPTMAPSGIFKTCDGKFVAIAAVTDEQYKAICEAMGHPELVNKYKDTFERLKPENAKELYDATAKWVGTSSAGNLVELAKKHGFSFAVVEDDYDITNDEWRRERGSVIVFTDDMYGKLNIPGPSAMLSKTPGRIKWLSRPLGYHNRYILKKILGYSEEEIKQLEKERVVGYWDDRPGIKPPVYYDIEKDPIFNYKGE
ncbi:MAG: CoA transferase [Dehalococcoidia bacterium]|nr:CoA transferase [Dehalococcoidia bacterium]MDD5493516.1 CoA transferase [Dehalococcoidia bacterium]